jgi:hypothetical protein
LLVAEALPWFLGLTFADRDKTVVWPSDGKLAALIKRGEGCPWNG